jgi:hypothetical protein
LAAFGSCSGKSSSIASQLLPPSTLSFSSCARPTLNEDLVEVGFDRCFNLIFVMRAFTFLICRSPWRLWLLSCRSFRSCFICNDFSSIQCNLDLSPLTASGHWASGAICIWSHGKYSRYSNSTTNCNTDLTTLWKGCG